MSGRPGRILLQGPLKKWTEHCTICQCPYTYRIVASTNTCYYSENQVLGGASTRDMSLNETCFYLKIQNFWILKISVSNMGKYLDR